jgi:flagellar hook-associated protein 3 FlgL
MPSVFAISQSTLGRSMVMNKYVNMNRNEMERASQELATGRRSDITSDLGMRSAEAYELRTNISKNERFILANKLTENKLDFQSRVMNSIREEVQDILNISVGNTTSSQNGTTVELQREAKSALERMISSLNTSIDGEFLFSGLDTQKNTMTKYDKVNALTGFSPEGVINGITGGSVLSLVDANNKISEIRSIFDSSNTVVPSRNYEDTFFNGTDLSVNKRREAIIGVNDTVEFGVQANDGSFFDMYQGLAMLTSVDVSTITDPAAYEAYMTEVVNKLSTGIQRLDEQQSVLGKVRQVVDEKNESLLSENDVLTFKVNNLESVDPYEAATRLSAFELQLEASYSATARLTNLTFLNYMF